MRLRGEDRAGQALRPFGYLGDRVEKRSCLAAALALMGAGQIGLAFADNVWQAMAAVMLIAPGFGGMVPVRPAMLADYFGTKHFGQINGWGRLMFTTGGAIGAWLVGYMFDVTGGYTQAWLLTGAFIAFGVPLMLLAAPPTDLMERYEREADEEWATPQETEQAERQSA